MATPPTSLRINDPTREALDAWAEYLGAVTGKRVTRAQVIELLVARDPLTHPDNVLPKHVEAERLFDALDALNARPRLP